MLLGQSNEACLSVNIKHIVQGWKLRYAMSAALLGGRGGKKGLIMITLLPRSHSLELLNQQNKTVIQLSVFILSEIW